jgi:hypothetical protein
MLRVAHQVAQDARVVGKGGKIDRHGQTIASNQAGCQ